MTLYSKVGTFTTPTSAGNQTVSGIGFTPVAVIIWGIAGFGTGWGSDSQFGMGFSAYNAAKSAFQQGATSCAGATAVTTTQEERRDAAVSFTLTQFNGGTPLVEGTITTMSSANGGEFIINWANVFTSGFMLNYLAIGGSDLKAGVLQWTQKTSTGTNAVTGLGFTPSCVMHIGSGQTTVGTPGTYSVFQIGAMDSAGNQWCIYEQSNPGAGTSANTRQQFTNYCFAQNANFNTLAQYSSMDADGFTVNFTASGGTAPYVWSLCLSGPSLQVGHWSKTTGANGSTDVISTTGTPVGIILATDSYTATGTAYEAGIRFGFGASDGTNNYAAGATEKNGVTTTVANKYEYSNQAIIVSDNDSGTGDANATFGSFTNGSLTATWGTNNAVSTQICYVSLGAYTATSLSISASPTSTNVGLNTTISGNLTCSSGGLSGKTVYLYRNSSNIASTTTTSGGAYSFTDTDYTAETDTYYVSFSANAQYLTCSSSTVNVTYSLYTTSTTASASPASLQAGANSTVSGNSTYSGGGIVGTTVNLYQYISSAWVYQQSATTTTGGAYSFTVTDATPETDAYVVQTVQTGTYAYSSSSLFTITFNPYTSSLTASASPTTLVINNNTTVSGNLTYSGGGIVGVTVYLYKGASNLTSATTTSGGAYSMTTTDATAEVDTYDVYFAGNSTYATVTSSSFNVSFIQNATVSLTPISSAAATQAPTLRGDANLPTLTSISSAAAAVAPALRGDANLPTLTPVSNSAASVAATIARADCNIPALTPIRSTAATISLSSLIISVGLTLSTITNTVAPITPTARADAIVPTLTPISSSASTISPTTKVSIAVLLAAITSTAATIAASVTKADAILAPLSPPGAAASVISPALTISAALTLSPINVTSSIIALSSLRADAIIHSLTPITSTAATVGVTVSTGSFVHILLTPIGSNARVIAPALRSDAVLPTLTPVTSAAAPVTPLISTSVAIILATIGATAIAVDASVSRADSFINVSPILSSASALDVSVYVGALLSILASEALVINILDTQNGLYLPEGGQLFQYEQVSLNTSLDKDILVASDIINEIAALTPIEFILPETRVGESITLTDEEGNETDTSVLEKIWRPASIPEPATIIVLETSNVEVVE